MLSLADIPAALRDRLEAAGVATKSILLEVARIDDADEQIALVDLIVEQGLTRDELRAMRRGEEPEPEAPAEPADPKEPSGRRITYRSGTGITLTLYLNRDEITVPEIQQTLREAIEELDHPPSS